MDRLRCSISVPLPQRPPKSPSSELPKKGGAPVPRAGLRPHKLSLRPHIAPTRPTLTRYGCSSPKQPRTCQSSSNARSPPSPRRRKVLRRSESGTRRRTPRAGGATRCRSTCRRRYARPAATPAPRCVDSTGPRKRCGAAPTARAGCATCATCRAGSRTASARARRPRRRPRPLRHRVFV